MVATGESHSVEDFVAAAFIRAPVGDWRHHVDVEPALIGSAKAAALVGDASVTRKRLGWTPRLAFTEVVAAMVDPDLE